MHHCHFILKPNSELPKMTELDIYILKIFAHLYFLYLTSFSFGKIPQERREMDHLKYAEKKGKKEFNNKQRKLSKDRVKANKQHASTVEPSTADTTSNSEFSKGAFVKISADSTSGVHPRENSACVGTVVSTEYSVEQCVYIVSIKDARCS